MDSTEVGRYGTLRLMKRLEPHKVVASYPIDEEEITFGRDPSCSIRLYYDAVSALHARIIFRDRKAFLIVLGTNGVIVDGCPVFPSTTTSGAPVTVPLPNNSSIEINKKTFTFSYPPKDLRQALLDTPSQVDVINTPDKKKRRRTLRMSMIQSAQVFTPRPSQDPRENLRILKTPIKTPFSSHSQAKTPQFGGRGRRRRESSPLKRGTYLPPQPEEDSDSEDEEPEADIVLVQTNHPKVVEEDRDLVILEHVDVSIPNPEPAPAKPVVQFPIPQTAQPSVVQTPQRRRRVGGRASLHRAVLIRSAQRAVGGLRGEMEEEEEEEDGEEEEVEETIQALEEVEEGDDEEGYDDEVEAEEGEENVEDEEQEEAEREEEQEQEKQEEEQTQRSTPLSGWRKSLGFVTGWALRSPAPSAQEESKREPREEHTHTPSPEPEDTNMDVEPSQPPSHSHPPSPSHPHRTPRAPSTSKSPRRSHQHPTRFMTPQVSRISSAGGRGRGRVARYSVGGFTPGGIYGSLQVPVGEKQNGSGSGVSGPRRVRVVEPWKVEDIVIPTSTAATGGAVEEEEEEWQDEDADGDDGGDDREEQREEEREREERVGTMSVSPSKRPVVSDAERKAILERRRSALTAPDTFFGGQVPGSRRMSLFPATSPLKQSQSPAKPSMSPFKGMATSPWKGMAASPWKGMPTPARRIPAPSFVGVGVAEEEEEVNPFAPPPSAESSSSHPEHHQYEEDDELAPPEEEEQEEKEDTQVLLARMKQTVENAKRRQSMGVGRPSIGLGVGVTPRKTSEGFSLLAPDAGDVDVPVRRIEVGEDEEEEGGEEEGDKENHDDGRVVVEDVEMDSGEEPLDEPIPIQSVVDQPTPSFKGVRELFATRPQLETPRMDGMREMFRTADTERVQATPAFEGLGEMLKTPVGWAAEVAADDDHDEPSEMETSDHASAQPQKKVPPPSTSTATKAPARRVPVATSRLATGPALAKAPLRRLGTSTVPRTVPGGLRITPTNRTDPGSSTSSTGSIQASGSGTVKSGGAGARVAARKTKAVVTVETALQEKEQEQEEVEVVEEKEEPEPEPVKPVRRTTRKTSASPAPEQPTTVRRSTRKTPTPTPEEPPAATAKSAGSSRRRAKTPTLPEVEEENAVDDGEDGKKVRRTRSARGKSTVEVKEEDDDDSPALTETDKPAPPARSTAGRAARGRGAGTASGLPRSTSTSRLRAPTATASSTKKAAGAGVGGSGAVAGKAKGASDRPNKENTPERGIAIEDEAVPSGTRAKVTRSGGRAGGDVAEKVTTAGARVSRAKARK
ncbi:hypothetical protein BC629DRAFT_1434608 [Irpex lacteus]|nr:hypothetical protein BC629DRAFT_1434608 [Irpex lacteus]